MTALPITGGCQCGACRYEVSGEPLRMIVCFCKECQRQSGSAFGASMILQSADFRFTSGEPSTWVRTAESGRTVKQLFCPACGCRLAHVPTWGAEIINIRAGTLDDFSAFRPSAAYWTRGKVDWVHVDGLDQTFEKGPPGNPLAAGKPDQ